MAHKFNLLKDYQEPELKTSDLYIGWAIVIILGILSFIVFNL